MTYSKSRPMRLLHFTFKWMGKRNKSIRRLKNTSDDEPPGSVHSEFTDFTC